MAKLSRNQARKAKNLKIRTKITGTAERPRLSVFRSHMNFSAQLIDDSKSITIVGITTAKKGSKEYHGNIKSAHELGLKFAKMIKEKNVSKIVFDRSGYLYHGRVKAFAEALCSEGIEF